MGGCSAVGCKNRPERKVPGVSFHRFPKDTVLRAAWIVACRRKNWMPSRISLLCSEHFSEDLIDRTSLAIVRLRENAIPNIFTYQSPSEKSDCQEISKNCKSPLEHLASTPITTFFEDEETLTCDKSISETTKEYGVNSTVSLNSSEDESSNEYVLPVPIPEKRKSTERRLAFKVAGAFVNEVVQSSDKSTSEITTNCNVIKPIVVCLNPLANGFSAENRPPVEIQKECNFLEKCLPFTATIASSNNEGIESRNESISDTPTEHDVVEPMIQQECNFPEKCLPFTATIASSNNVVIESSDESISDTLMEHDVVEPMVNLYTTVNEWDVEIPAKESDSENYPSQDIETINLKRKLVEANNLISRYRKKIKALQAQNRRYKEKLEKAKHSLSVLGKTNKSLFL